MCESREGAGSFHDQVCMTDADPHSRGPRIPAQLGQSTAATGRSIAGLYRLALSRDRLIECCREHPRLTDFGRIMVSNRSQLRPPFRAQSRPLLGLIELRGMAFAGVGRPFGGM
jgi:hypothetical protein